MAVSDIVFLGIKGSVVALDRATGTQVWATHLKGRDFVNVVLDEGEIYAAASGELFCLDQSTGQVRWHNPLKGFGWGLMTIATRGSSQIPVVTKRKRDMEAAAAASSGGAS